MGKIDKLTIPFDEVLDVIYGQKLDRGGYLEIVVPAIRLADKVHYTASTDSGINVEVGKDNEAVIQKYCGKKVVFVGAMSVDKDLYSREHITYIARDIVKRKVEEKSHELTFYWRLVKKEAKPKVEK